MSSIEHNFILAYFSLHFLPKKVKHSLPPPCMPPLGPFFVLSDRNRLKGDDYRPLDHLLVTTLAMACALGLADPPKKFIFY